MKIFLAITIFGPRSRFTCCECLIAASKVYLADCFDSGFKRDNCERLLHFPNLKISYQPVSIKIDFQKIFS